MRLLPLLGLAVAAILAGCGGAASDEATTPAPGSSPAATDSATKTEREDAADSSRSEAPDIAGTTLDGGRVALSDYRGQPVFLKVFAYH